MAQLQRQADVHQDKLCPPNKRYALMDANKKIDLDNLLCPNERKILANILQNHPLRFSIAASSLVPWIYMGQFWHTLKEDGSTYRLSFMLDRKELTLTLDDFRTIFQLPQATDNNHKRFIAAPKFSEMVPFFRNDLGFTLELRSPSNFKTTDHADAIIVSHYMTAFPEISRRVHDKYHNLEDDEMVKSIFNSGKNKAGMFLRLSHRRLSLPKLRIPPRWSNRLTPPTPIPTASDAEDIILQDTIELSIVKQKSHDELEAKQNVKKVEEHLIAEKIKKLVEGTENVENVEVDNSISHSQNDPDTRLEPKSNKESPEVEKTVDVSQPMNVIEEEDESAEDDYELRRREKGRRSHGRVVAQHDAIQQERENLRAEISLKINNAITNHIPSQASNTPCIPSAIRLRDQDDPHDDAHLEGEKSTKRQKTSEHGTYVFGESSSGQVNESEPGPSTSGDEHQYHIDQMQNFLKNDIKGNSGPKKIMLSLHKFPAVIFLDDEIKERTSRWVDKCVKKFNPYARYSGEHWKNPHAKIFYIKRQKEPVKPKEEIYSNSKIVQIIKTYGELGHEHKFVTKIIARRANGSIVSITEPDYKNLNKNDIEDIYLLIVNGKVDDYIETGLRWSLSVFIRSTVIWERVHDFQLGVESYQQKVNLIALTITFPGIKKYKMFSIIYEPVYGIIYKNNKKEKRVMRHQEVHKFCDATLERVLEGLKSYNNDVKHGYVTPSLSKEDDEYPQLFEEEIEERLKHHDQMRR
ncbi:hypothetical protein Tco_1190395 [Tanacetum coccineum]